MQFKLFLFYALLVSLIIGHYFNIVIEGVFNIPLGFYLYDFFILFIFLYSLFQKRNKYIDTVLGMFFIYNLILLFLNTKYLFSYSASLYLLRTSFYLLTYPFFSRIYKSVSISKVSWLILFGLILNLVIFFIYPVLSLEGYDPHVGRLYGPFIDPNLYSVLLNILVFVYIEKIYRKTSVLSFLILSIALVSIFLTFSRLGILLFCFSLLIPIIKNKFIEALPLLFAGLLIIFTNSRYLFRFLLVDGNLTSFFYRVLSYIEGIVIFTTNNIPVGFNNLSVYKYYLTSFVNNATSYTDGLILNYLITGGIFNVILFVFIFFYLYLKKTPFTYLLVFIVLSSFIINAFFHPYFLIVLSGCLGAAFSNKRNEEIIT